MKINRVNWFVVTLVVLVTVIISSDLFEGYSQEKNPPKTTATPTPEVKDTRDLSKYGSVNYNAPQIANQDEWERRRQISQRYDKQDWVVQSVNPDTGGIGKITEDIPPPLFPIEESPLIIVGEISKAEAFLSNDKGGVYTELTIRVAEILKNDGEETPKKVIADREGGVVIYPGGQRVRYGSSDRAMPLLGSKYLFFLVKDQLSPNYEILTSYYLDGNSIFQMESGRSFDEFQNIGKTAFIETVRNKIAEFRSNKQ